MAIDNAEKRKSASQIVSGLFGPGVTPTATKDIEWRQQAGWGYSGISAASVTFVVAWAMNSTLTQGIAGISNA